MNINQVYYVETTGHANPVAIKPEIKASKIIWMDTSKGKVVSLGKIDNIEILKKGILDVIEVTSERGEHYTLRKLTLQLYNEKVKPRVMLPPSFESDEAVQKFYLEKDFEII
jgi:hypothetical protein